MKTKKPKKPSRKSIVKRLDAIMSLYIRARDKYCVLCGTSENLTNGHLFSRVAYSTRWDEGNCFCQCASHNLAHEYNPHTFINWYIVHFGLEAYQALLEKHNTVKKFSNYELLELCEVYKQKYEALAS